MDTRAAIQPIMITIDQMNLADEPRKHRKHEGVPGDHLRHVLVGGSSLIFISCILWYSIDYRTSLGNNKKHRITRGGSILHTIITFDTIRHSAC